MPTAVASAVAPQIPQTHSQHEISPKSTYPTLAPSNAPHSSPSNPERKSPASATPSAPVVVSEGAAPHRTSPDGKRLSPNLAKSGHPPKIVVKKEPPSSPEVPATSRHRPRKLDLTSSTPNAARPSAPLTASASLGMHGMQDVGIACLSPGFQTQDPSMREQLQRSISVRDQQRHIIESRLQKTAKPIDSGHERPDHQNSGPLRTPMTSGPGKKRPPPGLSIVPPSHAQFANERVIQSAPLNQTFTGRHEHHRVMPNVANGPQTLSNSSHIHHPHPAHQTQNRLPPITDVFANEGLGSHREGQTSAPAPNRGPSQYAAQQPNSNSSHSNHRPPLPSPGLQAPTSSHGVTPQQHPTSRPREYRSAEEAVNDLAGGREELLPKIVHYNGHQPPPTPPSPSMLQQHREHQSHGGLTPNKLHHPQHPDTTRSGSGRRRPRAEYERDMGTPPLGSGPSPRRVGPFGEGRDSPESTRRKKEEFLGLCARAWDLFHS